MNVFRFELRRAWVGILVWTLVLTALLGGIIAGALPAFLQSRAGVENMLKSPDRARSSSLASCLRGSCS